MKISRYNHLIPMDSTSILLFNGVKGTFIRLDEQARKLYNQIAEGKPPVFDYQDAHADFQKLIEYGVIIDDDFDEVQYLQVMYRAEMFKTNEMIVTIAPTLTCNFRCIYCYEPENKKDVRMTPNVQEQTITFINKRLNSLSSLTMAWYGGEPLLEKKAIKTISEKLMESCKTYTVRYAALMVTNGYLLDKNTAYELRDYGITSVQVTIDGPKKVHDKRRVLANGKETFDRIITNLTHAVDIIPLLKIRVNIDQNNVHDVGDLLDVLNASGLKNKIMIYYAPVFGSSSACQDISDEYFPSDSYSKIEIDLFRKTAEKGYKMHRYPQPNLGGCSSLHINSFLIDPSGDIHKCWKTIGVAGEKIGTVTSPLEYNQNQVKWLSWDPFVYTKCKTCTFMPICMGGCPYKPILKQTKEPECTGWKTNIDAMLRMYYNEQMQANTKKS